MVILYIHMLLVQRCIVPLAEGSTVPAVADLFPDGAAGDVVLDENGAVSYIKMTKNGDNYYGPTKARILGGQGSGADWMFQQFKQLLV